jgi:hypothetical protein
MCQRRATRHRPTAGHQMMPLSSLDTLVRVPIDWPQAATLSVIPRTETRSGGQQAPEVEYDRIRAIPDSEVTNWRAE